MLHLSGASLLISEQTSQSRLLYTHYVSLHHICMYIIYNLTVNIYTCTRYTIDIIHPHPIHGTVVAQVPIQSSGRRQLWKALVLRLLRCQALRLLHLALAP